MLARTALAAVGRGTSGLRCSFCGRSAADVERLVAGASGYICDTCIAACVAVLDEHGGAPPAGPNR
jgi:ATP-dependent Clp protease ATP-binding subunit ClpX